MYKFGKNFGSAYNFDLRFLLDKGVDLPETKSVAS